MKAEPMRPAYAWEEYGRWYFTTYRLKAPRQSIEVELIVDDGRLTLSHHDGQQRRFIRGAERVEFDGGGVRILMLEH